MQLSKEQRIFVVESYLRTGSFKLVQQHFEQRFPERASPTKKTIWTNVKKFKTEGTTLNLNKERSGCRRTERTPENINLVREKLIETPKISTRRNGLDISKSTFNRIVKKDLSYHAYKMHVRHELLEPDLPRRLNFANWFLQKNARFVEDIVIGDEAAFHLNGRVNNYNIRQYAPRNNPPNFNFDVRMCREKVSVWMGMCGNGRLVGPIFYENIMNGDRYLNIIQEIIIPELHQIYPNRFNRLWWIQDGAPAHRSRAVQELLHDNFNNRIVALNQPIEWPPRSPDLTPCDFFLWGHLKSKVYFSPPENTDDLRNRIVNEVNLLKENPDLVKRVFAGMRKRLQVCVERNGGHVEGN